MDQNERIRTAFERSVKALKARASLGKGTAITKVTVNDGYSCVVKDGDWSFSVDMAEKHGGNNTGPNPGVFGRASLGTCLAIGYRRWSAILGVPVNSIQVEIQADYDARGEFAVADVTPAYLEMRYIVTVDSSADESEVMNMLDTAEKYTSFLAAFRDPQNLSREVRLTSTVEV
jgi:uncharacterized OsmC-like protein